MAMCSQCGLRKAQKDGQCAPCRVGAIGRASRKYRWTEGLREELRAAYRLSRFPRAAAVRKLMARTGWPHHAFQGEAIRLRLVTRPRGRAWTAEEDEVLRERLSSWSAARVAQEVGRSVDAVIARAERLRISRDITDGYSASELAEVFGVSPTHARGWMRRGLLGRPTPTNNGDRVGEPLVLRFIKRHASEYDLRRVDQEWFKAVLFAYRAGTDTSAGVRIFERGDATRPRRREVA